MDKSGAGVNAVTAVSLTSDGRAALANYSATLRSLLDPVSPEPPG
jgi:hypothetical protein